MSAASQLCVNVSSNMATCVTIVRPTLDRCRRGEREAPHRGHTRRAGELPPRDLERGHRNNCPVKQDADRPFPSRLQRADSGHSDTVCAFVPRVTPAASSVFATSSFIFTNSWLLSTIPNFFLSSHPFLFSHSYLFTALNNGLCYLYFTVLLNVTGILTSQCGCVVMLIGYILVFI